MKAVIQYVHQAQVEVSSNIIGKIKKGYVILIGIELSDTINNAQQLADKIAKLRIIPDENGKLNLNLAQSGGEILLVSQFTLCADTSSNRPSFSQAAPHQQAIHLLDEVTNRLKTLHNLSVHTGEFGAMMNVSLTNTGPITILLNS